MNARARIRAAAVRFAEELADALGLPGDDARPPELAIPPSRPRVTDLDRERARQARCTTHIDAIDESLEIIDAALKDFDWAAAPAREIR